MRRQSDNDEALKKLNGVLHVTMECLRVSAILLQPIVPKLTDQLLNKLNVPNNERLFRHSIKIPWNRSSRKLSSDSSILFQRIQLNKDKDGRKKPIKSL